MVHRRSIQRYVNDNNMSGNSPFKHGNKGNIPKWAYSVRIMQLNSCGHENTRWILSVKVNAAMGVETRGSNKLYYRVIWDTATDMKAAKINNVEDHWVQWTRYKKMKM